ncbi:RelA/SpoT family protein [Natronoglycomyces albus]|uniref:RelA/SpoT family protein n=1 Tax=Natronoglycomyces albus TaxID=2811108 RepID=UPI001FEAB4BE|nr:RelA/SpoT family protein [Natronoglycomyces albus]
MADQATESGAGATSGNAPEGNTTDGAAPKGTTSGSGTGSDNSSPAAATGAGKGSSSPKASSRDGSSHSGASKAPENRSSPSSGSRNNAANSNSRQGGAAKKGNSSSGGAKNGASKPGNGAEARNSSGGPPTGRRMRARLARFNAPWQGPTLPEVLEPLVATHRAAHPRADIRLLQKAYDTADRLHEGQFRKSGDPYITHPLAVASILAELGMDTNTMVAALLHDTVEDTAYALEELEEEFGGEVALLVDGVTKLDKVKLGDAAKAETIRKMVVAMAKDPRVLVIKLADRLHNMRTLAFLPQSKQEQKARETLEILAPLAHRLGMNTIKWELEDLSFATLYKKRYAEIARLVADHSPQREILLQQVTERVKSELKSSRIKANVSGRPKHLYSIYQKMIVRGRDFADIYDLVGLRILVDSERDCYAALGVIHANWQPVPGRFKDYIAMPKFNMYQSLHTTVIGPNGKPVEMQIRTWAMHRTAEYGIAAHWKYKETRSATVAGPPAHIDEMAWLRQLLDWQREAADPSEFLDALRFDLASSEAYVFTPKGDVIALPAGSTPVDFAYAVHTEIGHRCIGAQVNGKIVPLESTLSNGDVVEIFTSNSKDASPTEDWLTFVKSPRARTKIKQHFKKERREEAIEMGKELLTRAMRKRRLPMQRILTTDNLTSLAHDLSLKDVEALYAAIGEKDHSAEHIIAKLLDSQGGAEGASEDIAEVAAPVVPPSKVDPQHHGDMHTGIKIAGMEEGEMPVRLARCCNPIPGDDIIGFSTRFHVVSVHRRNCENAEDRAELQPDRVVEVSWADQAEQTTFVATIQVEALDRHRLLADVTQALSGERISILSATVTTTRDRVALSRFTFEMADPKHLDHIVKVTRNIEGVYDAYRLTSADPH